MLNFQDDTTHETEIFKRIGKTEAKRKKGRSQRNGKISPQLSHVPRTKKM